MASLDFQFPFGQQAFLTPAQPGFPFMLTQTKVPFCRDIQTKPHHRPAMLDHRQGSPDLGIIPVDHQRTPAVIDTYLGGGIITQAGITIHVIFTDIEDHGGCRL